MIFFFAAKVAGHALKAMSIFNWHQSVRFFAAKIIDTPTVASLPFINSSTSLGETSKRTLKRKTRAHESLSTLVIPTDEPPIDLASL